MSASLYAPNLGPVFTHTVQKDWLMVKKKVQRQIGSTSTLLPINVAVKKQDGLVNF